MTSKKRCVNCYQPFMVYSRRTQSQRLCPTCIDRRDKRPSVVNRRENIMEFDVQIDNLCIQWTRHRAGQRDDRYYKIDVGQSPNRIVIYADKPYQKGEFVRARVMRVQHHGHAPYTYMVLSKNDISPDWHLGIYKKEDIPCDIRAVYGNNSERFVLIIGRSR